MKYKKFHKLIEESNAGQKQATYQSIKEELNLPQTSEPDKKSACKRRNFFKKPARLAACISAAVAVVCLAIILPFTLNSGATPQTPSERYCQASNCEGKRLDCTLKEYSEQNNLSILYLDWYDFADSQATLFVNKEDETDIVYIEEELRDGGETGYVVRMYITDIHTKVDTFEYFTSSENIYNFSSVQVYWSYETLRQRAYFEYNGYKYHIEMDNDIYEGKILEIVEAMLP